MNYLLLALFSTVGTWFLTALGASTVFFFKKINNNVLNLMLGFSAGIMISASFWSLLLPAIEFSSGTLFSFILVSLGFLSGGLVLAVFDKIIDSFQQAHQFSSAKKRTAMLISSITLHNIPEGLAVGVAFGALKNVPNSTFADFLGPITVAIGIGLQNFPEGAAVSIPMRRDGYSRAKSFFFGQLSAVVEPIFGFLGALLVGFFSSILPFALSFAAGAMIFVVCHELIPEAEREKNLFSALGCILGFTIMMFLDVSLG